MKKNSQSRRAKNTPERREERFSAFPFPLPCLKIPYAFPGRLLFLLNHYISPGIMLPRALHLFGPYISLGQAAAKKPFCC